MTREFKTRIQLAGFWISLMILYVYADLFSFYRPGYVSKVIDGQMGILTVSQSTTHFQCLDVAADSDDPIVTFTTKETRLYTKLYCWYLVYLCKYQ